MDVAMGARISAMALLPAAPAHGSRTVAGDHESFRLRAGFIRRALLSPDGGAAGVPLSGCAFIRAGANRRRIRIDSYPGCERGGRPQPLWAVLRRLRSARLRTLHATGVLQPADAST